MPTIFCQDFIRDDKPCPMTNAEFFSQNQCFTENIQNITNEPRNCERYVILFRENNITHYRPKIT